MFVHYRDTSSHEDLMRNKRDLCNFSKYRVLKLLILLLYSLANTKVRVHFCKSISLHYFSYIYNTAGLSKLPTYI